MQGAGRMLEKLRNLGTEFMLAKFKELQLTTLNAPLLFAHTL
jgi:hypothetical protein